MLVPQAEHRGGLHELLVVLDGSVLDVPGAVVAVDVVLDLCSFRGPVCQLVWLLVP